MLTSRSPRRGRERDSATTVRNSQNAYRYPVGGVQVDRLPLRHVAQHAAPAHEREREQHQARAVRVHEHERRGDRGADEEVALSPPHGRRAVEPAAAEVHQRGRGSRARTCRARSPTATSAIGMTTRGWRPRNDSGTSTVNTSTPSSASPNISGRSDNTVKLHASAGIASASARTRSCVVWNATRNRNTATHAPARPTARRIPIAPTERFERAVHQLGEPRLRDPVRARRRERDTDRAAGCRGRGSARRCAGARGTSCRRATGTRARSRRARTAA